MGYQPQPAGGDDITKIGALADGFANTATNDSSVDDSNVGVGNGGNRDNTYNTQDNSQNLDIDAKLEVSTDNGNNRDNSYDWDYDSKTNTNTYNDNDSNSNNKTINVNDADTSMKSDYDWSYDSKSYSDNDTKTVTHTDVDNKSFSYSDNDTDIKTTSDSFNSSFSKTDTDFATLDHVKDIGNLGIAQGDLTYNIGDDFSFSLNVDGILSGSMDGAGSSAFSAVQANHLADQDYAYNVNLSNNAANNLNVSGGGATGAEGMDMDAKGWDLKAGDDVSGSSTADASAILANSGIHVELVQGANLLTNNFDASSIGGDSHHVGEDGGA